MNIVHTTAFAADAAVRSSRPSDGSPDGDRPPPDPRDSGQETGAGRDEPAEAQAEAVGSGRVVVREGLQEGLFIYTLADRITGQALANILREDVEAIAGRPDYKAGLVVDTRV